MVWHTIGALSDLPLGQILAVKIAGEKIAVYHLEDGVYATQSSCSHIFANLSKGKIVDSCVVECPLHRAQFDIRSGEVKQWACFPPGIQVLNPIRGAKDLRTFPCKLENEQILVEL